MWIDIIDLREFYASPMGRAVRRLIGQRLRALWPAPTLITAEQRMLGLGFATPFLPAFDGEAGKVVAAMPAGQGVMCWPATAANGCRCWVICSTWETGARPTCPMPANPMPTTIGTDCAMKRP